LKRAADGLSPKSAVERIAAAKAARRRELAWLPFKEKFRIVVELNRLASKARGKSKGD
jgi:hypothetical protein